MYWPSRQAKSEVHGPLRITYLDEEALAHYTVRRFEVKPVEHSSHYSQVTLPHVFLSRYILCCLFAVQSNLKMDLDAHL